MQPTRIRFLLVACVAVTTLAACGTEELGLDPDASPKAQEQARLYEERPPPNGMNGTSPSCFWAHGSQRALRGLGAAALDQGGGVLPSIPLNQVSSDCRQVLRSAIECSLTQDQSVTDPVTGEVYSGWWGLAPGWLGSALDMDGRRYVTACMVQRLNFYGTHVPILMEGPHPALAQSASFAPEYPMAESTVYGDLFSSTTPLGTLLPAFNVFACWENALPQSCGLLGLPLLFEKRICDDAPLCGLITLGPCALTCAPNDPYWKCKPGLLSPWWTQTVRVRLEQASCQ